MTTGYYKDEDDREPEMHFKKIVRNYVFSRYFPLDLCLVVVDWIIVLTSFSGGNMNQLSAVLLGRAVRVGRVLRFLKLLRVSKASGLLETVRQDVYHIQSRRTVFCIGPLENGWNADVSCPLPSLSLLCGRKIKK